MGYVLAAMLVVSGAFVVFVEAYGFSADTDAENLASGIGNAWKMLGAVAGMTLAWLLDRRYIHFEDAGSLVGAGDQGGCGHGLAGGPQEGVEGPAAGSIGP